MTADYGIYFTYTRGVFSYRFPTLNLKVEIPAIPILVILTDKKRCNWISKWFTFFFLQIEWFANFFTFFTTIVLFSLYRKFLFIDGLQCRTYEFSGLKKSNHREKRPFCQSLIERAVIERLFENLLRKPFYSEARKKNTQTLIAKKKESKSWRQGTRKKKMNREKMLGKYNLSSREMPKCLFHRFCMGNDAIPLSRKWSICDDDDVNDDDNNNVHFFPCSPKGNHTQ